MGNFQSFIIKARSSELCSELGPGKEEEYNLIEGKINNCERKEDNTIITIQDTENVKLNLNDSVIDSNNLNHIHPLGKYKILTLTQKFPSICIKIVNSKNIKISNGYLINAKNELHIENCENVFLDNVQVSHIMYYQCCINSSLLLNNEIVVNVKFGTIFAKDNEIERKENDDFVIHNDDKIKTPCKIKLFDVVLEFS